MESNRIHMVYKTPLFQLSLFLLEWLRTSSEEFLSFHASWMGMQPLQFHISTAADRWAHLIAAVLIVQALYQEGQAMSSSLY
jgi:hypothetical protein